MLLSILIREKQREGRVVTTPRIIAVHLHDEELVLVLLVGEERTHVFGVLCENEEVFVGENGLCHLLVAGFYLGET